MAAQAMPGEAILEKVQAARAETPVETVEALVAEHSLMAFRIAYSILRNHHDAEDAVQECFLRILKHAGRLHQVRSPKTWVARVAGRQRSTGDPVAPVEQSMRLPKNRRFWRKLRTKTFRQMSGSRVNSYKDCWPR